MYHECEAKIFYFDIKKLKMPYLAFCLQWRMLIMRMLLIPIKTIIHSALSLLCFTLQIQPCNMAHWSWARPYSNVRHYSKLRCFSKSPLFWRQKLLKMAARCLTRAIDKNQNCIGQSIETIMHSLMFRKQKNFDHANCWNTLKFKCRLKVITAIKINWYR